MILNYAAAAAASETKLEYSWIFNHQLDMTTIFDEILLLILISTHRHGIEIIIELISFHVAMHLIWFESNPMQFHFFFYQS